MELDRRSPAKLTIRVAAPLRDAIERAAQRDGVSMNAYATYVLAAAASSALREVGAEPVPGVPDDVPITAEEQRQAKRKREWELTVARDRWRQYCFLRNEFKAMRAPDDEVLEWFRREHDASQYVWRRRKG